MNTPSRQLRSAIWSLVNVIYNSSRHRVSVWTLPVVPPSFSLILLQDVPWDGELSCPKASEVPYVLLLSRQAKLEVCFCASCKGRCLQPRSTRLGHQSQDLRAKCFAAYSVPPQSVQIPTVTSTNYSDYSTRDTQDRSTQWGLCPEAVHVTFSFDYIQC